MAELKLNKATAYLPHRYRNFIVATRCQHRSHISW